jgi:siroheme decarboxylase
LVYKSASLFSILTRLSGAGPYDDPDLSGMQTDLDNIDKKILAILQGDLNDYPEPYAAIALELGISEEETLARISRMKADGVIRRFGAMIRHIEAGIGFNAMVVWKIPPERIEEVGAVLAGFPQITHCYERPSFGKFGGTVFTMVHAESEVDCYQSIQEISEKIQVNVYEILFSEKELKKISMTYFDDED